jgi:HSP20 family molecular chaperone IbpA
MKKPIRSLQSCRAWEEKDLDISIVGDTLMIKGEKQQEKEQKDKNHCDGSGCLDSFRGGIS